MPILSFSAIRSSILRGFGYIFLAQIPKDIIRNGVFLFTLIGVYILLSSNSVESQYAMQINIIASSISFTVGYILLRTKVLNTIKHNQAKFLTKDWLSSAFPLLFVGGVHTINQYTDLLMVGWIQGAVAAGVYDVVSRRGIFISFDLIAVNMAISTKVSELYSLNKIEELEKLISKATNAAFFMPYHYPLFLLFSVRKF